MNRRLIAAVTAVVLCAAPAAFATNGYFTHGTGTANKSMAGAGVALPQDALDANNNPAAAVFLESGYTVGMALFSPDRQYSIKGNPTGYPQTFGLTPGTVESKSKYFPMPSLGMNFRPSPTSAVTVSMIARGGMNTDYRTNTFYGSDHTGIDLGQMYLTATYAKKVADRHALGVSLIAVGQRFKASGLEAFGGFSSDATGLTGNGYDVSYGAGLQVGYLGQLSSKLSVGATWMPTVSMSKFEKYDGLFANGGGFDIPSSLSGGLAYKATPSVTLAADYQRIHYSDVRSVGQHLFPNLMVAQLGAEGGAGFGWDDVNVYKLGVQWQASPDWALRAGYSKCNNPVPDSEVLFNILAPGVIEQHYTFGLSKALRGKGGKLNFGMMYAPAMTVVGANPLEAPGAQQIELKMNEWEAEISYSIGF